MSLGVVFSLINEYTTPYIILHRLQKHLSGEDVTSLFIFQAVKNYSLDEAGTDTESINMDDDAANDVNESLNEALQELDDNLVRIQAKSTCFSATKSLDV